MAETANPSGPVRPGGRAMERGEEAQPAPMQPPAPQVQPAQQPETGPVQTGNDKIDALFGPTAFPHEPITAGINTAKMKQPPSSYAQSINDLVQAAKDPNAPPELVNLVRLLAYHLSQG